MSDISPDSKPTISVITVVRNGEKTIERCILSVIPQLNQNIEYLVIDGESKDKTVSIIQKYESSISYWHSKKDKNIADAFNQGVKHAKGEYVIFLNADDWFNEGVLTSFLDRNHTAEVVHGDIKYWSKGEEKLVRFGNQNQLENEMSINHPATFMKRKLINQLGGFNTNRSIALDYELILKAKKGGHTFQHVSEIITNMSLDGISDENWFKSCQETYEVKQDVLGKSFKNKFWFYKQSGTLFIIKSLEIIGLQQLISSYRSASNKWEK